MSEIEQYYKFTSKARLEKAVFSLLGILQGIAIDGLINPVEAGYLAAWLAEQQEYSQRHPFDEILPLVAKSLSKGVLSSDDRDDINWLCDKIQSTEYYGIITQDLQRLHAILAGIAADGMISTDELHGLMDWLADHEHLRRCWPYDEIDSLITGVLKDQKIDEHEHALLLHFFGEFSEMKPAGHRDDIQHPTLQGLCAAAPSIRFDHAVFCFTGAASLEREELEIAVIDRGGSVSNTITQKTQYLVIGSKGNPCWAYACYGRKVEQAVKLRKAGYPLVLVHEADFLDSINE